MKSTATARWEGAAGKITAGTGLFKDAPYNAKGRFEGGEPYTTPEELIAAAHAACFSMAFNVGLSRNGINAKSIETKSVVEVLPASRRRFRHHAKRAHLYRRRAGRRRCQGARDR